MANKVRNILQVVDRRGNYGVMIMERDLDSDKVFVTVTVVDPENGSIDVEEGIVMPVDETQKRTYVWDYNTPEAEVSING
jgi:hypothetical protein